MAAKLETIAATIATAGAVLGMIIALVGLAILFLDRMDINLNLVIIYPAVGVLVMLLVSLVMLCIAHILAYMHKHTEGGT